MFHIRKSQFQFNISDEELSCLNHMISEWLCPLESELLLTDMAVGFWRLQSLMNELIVLISFLSFFTLLAFRLMTWCRWSHGLQHCFNYSRCKQACQFANVDRSWLDETIPTYKQEEAGGTPASQTRVLQPSELSSRQEASACKCIQHIRRFVLWPRSISKDMQESLLQVF